MLLFTECLKIRKDGRNQESHKDFFISCKIFSGIFLGVKSGRRVGMTTLPLPISRMPENVGASTFRNPKGLNSLCRENFTLPYLFRDFG
jgi:hypothetical protein